MTIAVDRDVKQENNVHVKYTQWDKRSIFLIVCVSREGPGKCAYLSLKFVVRTGSTYHLGIVEIQVCDDERCKLTSSVSDLYS